MKQEQQMSDVLTALEISAQVYANFIGENHYETVTDKIGEIEERNRNVGDYNSWMADKYDDFDYFFAHAFHWTDWTIDKIVAGRKSTTHIQQCMKKCNDNLMKVNKKSAGGTKKQLREAWQDACVQHNIDQHIFQKANEHGINRDIN